MLKTKAATIEHVKKILHSNINKTLEGEDLNFILSILPRHPEYQEKIGSGVKNIIVKRTSFNNPCFHIERSDGSLIDFSYKSCINGKPMSTSNKLNEALRFSIMDQIIKFKEENLKFPFKCPLCLQYIEDKSKIVADHVDNKFRYLSHCYKLINDVHPEKFDDHPTFNCSVFKPIDSEFENKWKEYHKKYAQLRLICSQCNSKEG